MLNFRVSPPHLETLHMYSVSCLGNKHYVTWATDTVVAVVQRGAGEQVSCALTALHLPQVVKEGRGEAPTGQAN